MKSLLDNPRFSVEKNHLKNSVLVKIFGDDLIVMPGTDDSEDVNYTCVTNSNRRDYYFTYKGLDYHGHVVSGDVFRGIWINRSTC